MTSILADTPDMVGILIPAAMILIFITLAIRVAGGLRIQGDGRRGP